MFLNFFFYNSYKIHFHSLEVIPFVHRFWDYFLLVLLFCFCFCFFVFFSLEQFFWVIETSKPRVNRVNKKNSNMKPILYRAVTFLLLFGVSGPSFMSIPFLQLEPWHTLYMKNFIKNTGIPKKSHLSCHKYLRVWWKCLYVGPKLW